MQSNANPITFKKNWKINSFLMLSSQNAGRDPKLHWKVPRRLAQVTIQSTLSSKWPWARLSQKHFLCSIFFRTGLWRVEAISPVKGVQVFNFISWCSFFPSPAEVVPESIFTLKNYLLPTGRINLSAWLEPCRTPKGFSWLCISLLRVAWRTITSIRKGLQKWKHTI